MNSVFTAFKFMDDETLTERIARLERKVAEYRRGSTSIARTLHRQFTEALAAARAELDRRRAC